ncbi:DUF2927 domain-containing protein [Sulfitobacter donghicola]|uniref:ATP-dependent transcriptional regulator n=1 Tax=Sulfitobacter donghicola DSW-25 = KCTC 12864 = JCM 14565 TaxID=1300350 RepID=A0A073IED9_9RHOB|nr:DUF2927 domain-containing protein [Sulfitobacter donghicola]KEJ87925.1 hypothetical protein DSW25_04220 [Sulfitobacter donghicola DSW-25 = KCTC 12864 = JCM 14565]KIN66482.1 DUF2927 domain containing protein [Sulfitobacter donghicola DSW-25 = KCTC 12864 = JCM 14565]
MKSRAALILAMALNACTPTNVSEVSRAMPIANSSLPPVKVFSNSYHAGPVRANNDLALDFIELSFKLESGRELPVFTRFEGPVTVTVVGQQPPSLQHDLTRLLNRLRTEARINISQVNAPRANITINAVPRKEIRKLLPQAACFVAPNVSTLDEYRKARKTKKANWSLLRKRERLAIFLPNDVSPQEVRDCLHEEVAQSLGPLNDLYRLPDSVFNDDNVHTVLTGFDMLMLRAYYSPQLHNGMSRGQVAATLPHILRQINPRGEAASANFPTRTPIQWKKAIEGALGPASSRSERLEGASEALRIAKAMGWQDQRRAFAHYAMGRVLQRDNPKEAQRHYSAAKQYYAATPGTKLHQAYVATQLSAFAVSQGQGAQALQLIAPHVETARANENAALLSTLLLLRAEALDLENRPSEAKAVRMDSLGWARYGFGSDWAVRAKLREISSLNPLKG